MENQKVIRWKDINWRIFYTESSRVTKGRYISRFPKEKNYGLIEANHRQQDQITSERRPCSVLGGIGVCPGNIKRIELRWAASLATFTGYCSFKLILVGGTRIALAAHHFQRSEKNGSIHDLLGKMKVFILTESIFAKKNGRNL